MLLQLTLSNPASRYAACFRMSSTRPIEHTMIRFTCLGSSLLDQDSLPSTPRTFSSSRVSGGMPALLSSLCPVYTTSPWITLNALFSPFLLCLVVVQPGGSFGDGAQQREGGREFSRIYQSPGAPSPTTTTMLCSCSGLEQCRPRVKVRNIGDAACLPSFQFAKQAAYSREMIASGIHHPFSHALRR